MPNLINQDGGNTFYNYITPLVFGEGGVTNDVTGSAIFLTFLRTAWGTNNVAMIATGTFQQYNARLPAPGLETKTGVVQTNPFSGAASRVRFRFRCSNQTPIELATSNNSVDNTHAVFSAQTDTDIPITAKFIAVANDFSFCFAAINADKSFNRFYYVGYLRETGYSSSSVSPLGLVGIYARSGGVMQVARVAVIGGTTLASLSSAADSITSPPIVCTPGTDPGNGSATYTDIVVRDSASPNNAIGKLWNCIDLPAAAVVGGLYRNVGAYDADGGTSTQDIYLCIMPWGTRKLGMRVWTENV